MKHLQTWGVLCAAVALYVPGSARAGVTFTSLGGPNWFWASGAADMTPDGRIIVGTVTLYGTFSYDSLFRWSQSAGFDVNSTVGPDPNDSSVDAVSADGNTIVGTLGASPGYDAARPYVWRAGQGGTNLGLLPGGTYAWARGVSGDASTVVGYGDSSAGAVAWKWTSASGYVPLTTPAGITSAYMTPHGIDTAGDVILGYGSDASNELHAIRWTASGSTVCPMPSSPNGLSRDGRQALFASDSGEAMRWWDDGRIDDLGAIPGASNTVPSAASDDGRIVAGYFVIAPSTIRAWIWTADTGVVDLNQYLPSIGVNIDGWVLWEVTSMSDDGSTLAGWGYHTYGPGGERRQESFILTIPAPAGAAPLLLAALAPAHRRRRPRTTLPYHQ